MKVGGEKLLFSIKAYLLHIPSVFFMEIWVCRVCDIYGWREGVGKIELGYTKINQNSIWKILAPLIY